MKLELKGRKYKIDKYGVLTQIDHRPFVYDPNYSAIYDKPEYTAGNNILQALRLGFVIGSHGSVPKTLMDVGYGNGAFINFVKKVIPHIYGHDITGVPLEGAYSLPEMIKAEVYCFWDVLEHFPDCSFLSNLPCETIFISLPYCHIHTQGVQWVIDNYKHLKPDEHIRHFNEWTLTAFMSQYGWKAVAISNHEDLIRKTAHGLQNILTMAFKR